MKVHSVNVRSKPDTSAQHLHLGVAEKSNTNRFSTWRERATMDEEPLIRVRPPVNQHTIGEMELVPSAVGPSPIEQRFQIAKARTPRRWSGVQRRGGVHSSFPLGAVIDKRPAPEASCPPAAQAKKTIDLVDIKSASVSAQIKEGERIATGFALAMTHIVQRAEANASSPLAIIK